ncbi:MAG: hypothetical protein HOP15_07940 [Planctomycetes bacterium]|nr:hypothetical protein [Planctomycetota bacterium]
MNPLLPSLSVLLLAVVSPRPSAQVTARRTLHSLRHDQYVVDFVSSAADGFDMNNAGVVVGRSYLDTGCGPFCLPPEETVVWRGGERIVLPGLPGFTGTTATSVNNAGWIAGFAGSYNPIHAVVWQPVGSTYRALDLGVLPGTTISQPAGIDDQGRVVGWSTDGNAIGGISAPFLWSLSTGMVDLSTLGYPDEQPFAISPGGTVATANKWYRLGNPASVVTMPAPPSGFGLGGYGSAINDAGDQARLLARTSGQNLVYLFRFHHEGSWQQLSASPTGHLSRAGVGSINDARDVTATITSRGVIAYGPNGLAQALDSLLSPAYPPLGNPDSTVASAGPMNRRGEILAEVMLGRSPRLVRLTPSWGCWSGCLRVDDLAISANFVPDPNDPSQDHCAPDLSAYNEAYVVVRVTGENAAPQAGVLVAGRFLDDYWTNEPVSATTDASGVVSFSYTGLCGVGAIAFLVDSATRGQASLDKTAGILSVSAVPQ